LAGPRGLVGAHAAALTARARTHAAYASSDASADERAGYLGRARDDAEAALRLATHHGLAWHELDALDAHASIDALEGVRPALSKWAAQAGKARHRLIPPGLDPDPLLTVEGTVNQ